MPNNESFYEARFDPTLVIALAIVLVAIGLLLFLLLPDEEERGG